MWSAVTFADRVRQARVRFAADRKVADAWVRARAGASPPAGAELGVADPPSALSGVGAVARIALTTAFTTPLLSRDGAVRSSPIATEIRDARRRLVGSLRHVPAGAVDALRRRDPSSIAGTAVELLDLEHALLRRLALIGSPPVPDVIGGLAGDAPYPSYRCSAANRGQVKPFADPPSGAEPWSVPLGALIWPTAVVDANGDLYVGHAEGEFVALHADGTVKWRLADPQMMYVDSTGALGRDGYLYLASTDVDTRGHQNQGRLWKVDPASGDVLWTFWARHFEDPEENPRAHLSGFFEGKVALGLEHGRVTVYAGSDDNHLYKLDADGKLLWEYDTGSHPAGVIWTKPLLSADGETVFIGEMSGRVHAVRVADGSRRWASGVGGAVVSSPALGLHGEIVAGSFDGKLYCLDASDGEILWSYQTLGLVYSSPAVDAGDRGHGSGDVVIGSSDGGIYRLDRFGRRRWTYWTDAPIKASPSLDADGNTYVGNQNGKIYCIGPDGRRRWSFATNPDLVDNDLNGSPSLGRDGTLFVGSTTGELFTVPRGWCEAHGDDARVSLDPDHDADRPAIEPGGGTLVYLDRSGTPCFTPPERIGVHENLNLALFGVDHAGDVVETRLAPSPLEVDIDPETPADVRVESMGRYLYVIPQRLLEADTSYRIAARGIYDAAGEKRRIEHDVELRTGPAGEDRPPLAIDSDRVDAVVLHAARVAVPKEIDALGQAMIDSQNFLVAPLHLDADNRRFLAAVCWVHDSADGSFEYRPATVNKTVAAGSWSGAGVQLECSLRVIAQGINIPFERIRFGANAVASPEGADLSEVSAMLRAPAAGIEEFADLIRVMGLSDDLDDTVGFLTFSSTPYRGSPVSRPPGVECALQLRDGEVRATFGGLEATGGHWLHVDYYDEANGGVYPGTGASLLRRDDGGAVVSCVVPDGLARARAVAVASIDLFPVASSRLSDLPAG